MISLARVSDDGTPIILDEHKEGRSGEPIVPEHPKGVEEAICSGPDPGRGHAAVNAKLPPPTIKRWSPQRKASVVEAVRSGVISFDEACRRYQLSAEEFKA